MRAAADAFVLVPRKGDRRCRVGRKRDGEAMIALLPVGDDGAVSRVVLNMQRRQRGVEVRMNGEVMETWSGGISVNAGSATINPGHHRTEGIVVIRVHTRVASVAVPSFPPRSRPLLHHVPPGGVGVGE